MKTICHGSMQNAGLARCRRIAGLAPAALAAAAMLSGGAFAGAQAPSWTARKNGSGSAPDARPGAGNGNIGERSVAVDGSGNAYVTGYSNVSGNYDYLTVSYSSAGAERWARSKNGPGNSSDEAYAVVVDGNGNSYVTGQSWNGANQDYLTVSYDSSGNERWSRVKNGSANSHDKALALVVDSAGNVYVSGHSSNGSNYDFLTVSYDSLGNERWARVKNGAANRDDYVYAIAIDGSQNVFVTGSSRNTANADYFTVSYDSAGTERWARVRNGAANSTDEPLDIAVDASGNAFVTGYSSNGSNYDFLTVSYDGSGTERWARVKNGSGNGADQGNAVTVDGVGNVYVTGQANNGTNADFLTVSYDNAGTEQWTRVKNGSGNGNDWGYNVLADSGGQVYVVGSSPNAANNDYLVVAYDPAGTELWSYVFDAGSQDSAYGLARRPGSGVIVTGYSLLGTTGYFTLAFGPVDTTQPSDPTLTSTVPPAGAWSNDNTVGVTWSGAADDPGGLGLAGYSLSWDHASGTTPDTVVDIPHTADPHSATSPALAPDGNDWYFHLRTCDLAGNCTATVHAGPFWIDTTAPGAAAGLHSTSHWIGVPSPTTQIDLAFAASTDGLSGVDGYAVAVDGSPAWACDGVKDIEESTLSFFEVVAAGSWYAHVCALDSAGNAGAVMTSGPFVVGPLGSDPVIYWTSYGSGMVGNANADGSSVNVLVSVPGGALGVQVDPAGEDLYWAETGSNQIRRGALDGSGAITLVSYYRPRNLALDLVHGHIYWTAELSNQITRANLDGTGQIDYLPAPGSNPWGLALDLPGGKIYWSEYSGQIRRGNLDGTGIESLTASAGTRVGLALDRPRGKVYWAEEQDGTIHRTNLDGSGHAVIVTGLSGVRGIEIDELNQKLYWVVMTANLVRRSNLDGTSIETVFTTPGTLPHALALWHGDTTAPADPAIDSTSPAPSSWSNDNTVLVTWSSAAEEPGGSGLAGYSIEWNHTAVSTPDAVVDVPHTSDPHSTTSAALVPDGNDWYFHLRTCDVAGNCTATVHEGPFWIDTAAPAGVSALASTSHVVGVASEADSIAMSWSEPGDSGSGLDGYSWDFTGSATWTCETTQEAQEGTTSATSSSLAPGSWYFHVCARDNAGNWGAVVTAGPFQITDTTLPTTCALPFERKWGSFGTGAGQFRRPFGVGAGPGGEVVVADFDNGRLQVFDNLGNFVHQWSTAGGPVSVALDSHGHAVVSNLYAGNVQVFALDGTLVDHWATGSPYGLTVDATDHVYAVNDAANRVTKYDHDGNFVLQFGSTGAGNGQFLRAWGVATAPGGDVFVTDINGHTVQRFTAAGAFVAKWGSYGAGAGQLNAPAGISISPVGVVYVSEVANRRIQAFTLEGFPLCAWGSSGSGDGQFLDPLNVAFSAGHLYVADHLNHRIQKFGFDEIPPSDPTSTSTSPPVSTWSNDNTVQMNWSGAADNLGGAGVAGYSVEWNHSAVSTPDGAVDVPHTVDPHSATSAALAPDGNDWYFHLRTCDLAANCTATLHVGPFWIDTTAPSAPGTVSSLSHGDGLPKSNPTVDISWGAASDGLSGVASYRYGFTATATPPACSGLGTTTATLAGSSGSLADGIWYAHVCAVDGAGNLGAVTAGGPYLVDTTAPTGLVVSSSSHTVSTWSSDASIEFAFSGATDANGVAGYAVVFDTAAGTVPACAATQAGQSFTGTASPDGSGWRLHVRAIDDAGNCGGSVSFGPFWIDTTAPPAPGTVVSPSHDGGATNDPTIDVEWGPSSAGAGAPIAGYRFDFWSGAVPPACSALTGNSAGTSASSPALGEGDWYLSVCAVDGAGNESTVTTGGPYTIDTSGPTGLLVASTSHALATWSSDGDVDFAFSGAIDPNGVAGYSIAFDQAAATVPDSTPEQAGTTFTGTASPDSANWYLHVRACDSAGNCSVASHAGPYWIDTGAPSATGALTSASHGDGEPHSDPTVAIAWGAASDVLSGVAFYRYDFTALAGAPDCATLVATTPDLTAISGSLADGTWYAHVCAVDAAGNSGAVASGGPYRIDTAPPTVEAFDSVARTADLVLTEGEVVDQPLTQVYVSFAEEMFDPPGDTTPGDVTNPAGWLLVASGPDGIVDSAGCTVAGDDVALPLAVTWSAATRTAHLAPDGNQALAAGGYLVAACGTLLDPAGNPLDGDGNGTGGDARARTFAVRGTDLAGNPNFDAGLAGWTVVATVPGEVAADLDDAGEQPTSGSVAVTSSAGAGETWQVEQCVASAGARLEPPVGSTALRERPAGRPGGPSRGPLLRCRRLLERSSVRAPHARGRRRHRRGLGDGGERRRTLPGRRALGEPAPDRRSRRHQRRRPARRRALLRRRRSALCRRFRKRRHRLLVVGGALSRVGRPRQPAPARIRRRSRSRRAH